MVQLAIRCHPVIPVSAEELEQWLDQQLHNLRAEAPLGIIRMSRLAQGPTGSNCYIGWLVELELPEGDPLLAGDRLFDALRDMRLLGLQPTLLSPTARSADALTAHLTGSERHRRHDRAGVRRRSTRPQGFGQH